MVAFTLLFIVQDARWARSPWVAPVCALVVMAATGALNCAASGLELLTELPGLVAEAALCAGGTYFFREALSSARPATELAEKRHGAAAVSYTHLAHHRPRAEKAQGEQRGNGKRVNIKHPVHW